MAAAKNYVGTLEAYNVSENFGNYLDRMENYFELNEIEEEKTKILLLNNLIGPDAGAKLIKACKPKKPKEFKYDEIVEKCRSLFAPQSKTCTNPIIFAQRMQNRDEKVNDFAIELMSLAENCGFGSYKDKALRTQLIAGVQDRKTKAVLMSMEDTVSFKQCVEKAVALELIEKDLKIMEKKFGNTVEVNKVGGNYEANNRKNRSYSKNTGYNQHQGYNNQHQSYRQQNKQQQGHWQHQQGNLQQDDRQRNYVCKGRIKCFKCEGYGHMAKQCPSQQSTKSSSEGKQFYSNNNNFNHKLYRFQRKDDFKTVSNSNNSNKIIVNEDGNNLNFGNLALVDNDSSSEANSITLKDRNNVFELEKFINSRNSIDNVKLRIPNVEFIQLNIENSWIKFEVDTGACVSLCNLIDYNRYFSHLQLEQIDLPLSVLTGNEVRLMGRIKVKVESQDRSNNYQLDLVVINTKKNIYPLCGRNWLDVIRPRWRDSFQLNSIESCEAYRKRILPRIKEEFKSVFDGDMSNPVKEFEINIILEENVNPIFHKAYTLPFSMREKVDRELGKMEKQDIIVPITISDWASPIVLVPKPNQEIRICIDCSKTINNHVCSQHYPLPVIDEVLASLGGNKYFASIDLKGAYTQLKLSESSQRLVTINTHRGLYKYKRLPFGLKPAASMFQSVIDQVLRGIPGTFAYIDDILIGGKDLDEVYNRLRLVLLQLQKYNIKANWAKCNFFVEGLRYLGHEVSAQGIGPCKKKIKAIINAPAPTNVSQLKSFVGLLNFYSKFLPRLNGNCAVLYNLLRKGNSWDWNERCQRVFEDCKRSLVDSVILEHYDAEKPMVIVCDASDVGISGILCHIVGNVEKPVFFVSRTLTNTERKYPILHREALAVVFALEKFYKYIYGHQVVVFSDHKPLEVVLDRKRGQSAVITTRLQRYINRLSMFDYEIKYRPGSKNGNADCLSRLPIKSKISEEDVQEESLFELNHIEWSEVVAVDIEMVKQEMNRDPFLEKLKYYIVHGWNQWDISKEYKNYYAKNEFLTVERGFILYRGRLVIPKSMYKVILGLLHRNHCGMVKMKVLARKYVFWEGIDRDIEVYINSCSSCQATRNNKSNKIYMKWPEVTEVFERIHIDFFHFEGKNFLIMIDVFSRWLEVVCLDKTDADRVGNSLDEIFRFFGYPTELVSDNGPPFNSEYFMNFCKKRGIRLTHTPPYHPSSNGQVERAVQTTKNTLKKFVLDSNRNGYNRVLTNLVREFLKNYNNLPCTEENFIPSHKVFSFSPKTDLDLLRVEKDKQITNEYQNNRNDQNENENRKGNSRENVKNANYQNEKKKDNVSQQKKLDEFKKGEIVLLRSYSRNYDYINWSKAKILERESVMIYKVLVNNLVKRAHVNQLKKCILENYFDYSGEYIYETQEEHDQNTSEVLEDNEDNSNFENVNSDGRSAEIENVPRKSNRIRKTPSKFKDYVYE